MKNRKLIFNIIFTAIMAGLMTILIFIGSINIGIFKITLCLIPICICSIICGKFYGMFLGLLMGFIYLITGEAAVFMEQEPFWTIVLMLTKSGAAGFLSGLAYELISKKNTVIATWVASIICPLVNTGLFITLSLIFLNDYLTSLALGEGMGTFAYVIVMMVGANFFVELIVSVLIAPIVTELFKVFKK